MTQKLHALLLLIFGVLPTHLMAQDITVSTVTREPFSMQQDGIDTGFSIDLMNQVAEVLDLNVSYLRTDSFGDMLVAVQDGRANAAIANISMTAERERLMDFSQPMFDSGIKVMMAAEAQAGSSVLNALFTRQIGLSILGALGILFVCGMLMWFFERRKQPYFDHSASDAAWPAFWWALNLVVNGGFEERVPRSTGGRFFAVMLVISSLFIVSIFVAQITAALTVNAIKTSVDGINDLGDRAIASIEGSTSQAFLEARGMSVQTYTNLDSMFAGFESGRVEAVVFDAPILAYYAANSNGKARVLDRVYNPENYAIAFPAGSMLREDVNQAMLQLREDGSINALIIKWFGPNYR